LDEIRGEDPEPIDQEVTGFVEEEEVPNTIEFIVEDGSSVFSDMPLL